MSHKIFVYGTLKHGEPNYYVLQTGGQGLNDFGDQKSEFQAAKFVTSAETVIKYPLVIASKFNIPFLLDRPGIGNLIKGEVYEVNDLLLKILDDFEGHPDYYIRREENVQVVDGSGDVIKCWIYVLPKFKPEMLELEYLNDYHSDGDHGKPYDTEEEAYSVDDLDS